MGDCSFEKGNLMGDEDLAWKRYVDRLTAQVEPKFSEINGYIPEWFLDAQEIDCSRGRYSVYEYERTIRVICDMEDGKFESLADMIQETGDLPALIRRALVFLIKGDAEQSGGFRITRTRHPDIDGRSPGRLEKMRRYNRNFAIASFIASRGALNGQFEAAIADAIGFFGLKRASVVAIWSEHKDDVLRSRWREANASLTEEE